jgi:hypothetical protein
MFGLHLPIIFIIIKKSKEAPAQHIEGEIK